MCTFLIVNDITIRSLYMKLQLSALLCTMLLVSQAQSMDNPRGANAGQSFDETTFWINQVEGHQSSVGELIRTTYFELEILAAQDNAAQLQNTLGDLTTRQDTLVKQIQATQKSLEGSSLDADAKQQLITGCYEYLQTVKGNSQALDAIKGRIADLKNQKQKPAPVVKPAAKPAPVVKPVAPAKEAEAATPPTASELDKLAKPDIKWDAEAIEEEATETLKAAQVKADAEFAKQVQADEKAAARRPEAKNAGKVKEDETTKTESNKKTQAAIAKKALEQAEADKKAQEAAEAKKAQAKTDDAKKLEAKAIAAERDRKAKEEAATIAELKKAQDAAVKAKEEKAKQAEDKKAQPAVKEAPKAEAEPIAPEVRIASGKARLAQQEKHNGLNPNAALEAFLKNAKAAKNEEEKTKKN